MAAQNTDTALLEILQKMTDRKKLSFALGCLERLDLSKLFNKSDAMLFADTQLTIKACLDGITSQSQLDEFIAFIAPRCGELHLAATGKPHLVADKYNVRARSYAADAIYATAELVYHYFAEKNCPVHIMHTLENIRLSKKCSCKNDHRCFDIETTWQLHYATSLLSDNKEPSQQAQIIVLPKKM